MEVSVRDPLGTAPYHGEGTQLFGTAKRASPQRALSARVGCGVPGVPDAGTSFLSTSGISSVVIADGGGLDCARTSKGEATEQYLPKVAK